MLTKDDLRFLLEELAHETLYEEGRVRLQRKGSGWSDDPKRAKVQAALSIMLEGTSRG
jgi:hypothetical protein